MLEFYDFLFHAIHITFIIINVICWMSFRTLKIAQVTLSLTLVSWIGFGFKYGFGYCFLTDWHWQLKERMGEIDLPHSYIKLVLDRSTGYDWNPQVVDQATTAVLIISLMGCLIQSYRAKKRWQ